jgi:Family of unknown function (DUF5723)
MKLSYSLLVLILLFFSANLSAQDSSSVKRTPYRADAYSLSSLGSLTLNAAAENSNFNRERTHFIYADFDFHNISNAVNTDISRSFLFNGFIDQAMKDRTYKQLKKNNTYEDGVGGHVAYVQMIRSKLNPDKGWQFSINYQYANNRFLHFGDQALKFALSGNAMFENDTIHFNKLVFDNRAYNKLSASLQRVKKTQHGTWYYGGGLSLLQGIQNTHITLDNSSLYTAPDGEWLDVKYKLHYQQSTIGAPNFFAPKGLGGAADLYLSYEHKKDNALDYYIRFSATDIGFIRWQRDIAHYDGDSAIRFEGLVINNLLNFSTPSYLTNFGKDSLFAILHVTQSGKSYNTVMPMKFALTYGHALCKGKAMMNVGANYQLLPGYIPQLWGKFSYGCKYGFVPSISASFGGYSYYNVGLELSKLFRYGQISIGSQNVAGLIIPSHVTASSVYARLGLSF